MENRIQRKRGKKKEGAEVILKGEEEDDNEDEDRKMAGRCRARKMSARWRTWLLVICLFFVGFIEMGVVKSFGVLIADLAYQLDTDLHTLGTIIGTYHGIAFILCPLVTPFLKYMNAWVISLIGITGATCLGLSSLVSTVAQFAASLIISGICGSFVNLGSVTRFEKHVSEGFALAFGIADTGNAIGMIILPVLTQFARHVYGWRGSLLLLGGVCLHIGVVLLLMEVASSDTPEDKVQGLSDDETMLLPSDNKSDDMLGVGEVAATSTELDSTEDKAKSCDSALAPIESEADEGTFDTRLVEESRDEDINLNTSSSAPTKLTNTWNKCKSCLNLLWHFFDLAIFIDIPCFFFISFSHIITGIISTAWVVFLIPHGVSAGYPLSQAVFLASFGGAGNVIGRVLQGPIVDKGWMTSLDLRILLTVINSVVFLSDPLLNSFWLLALAAFVGGLTFGARSSLGIVVWKQFIPRERFSTAYGLGSMFYGAGEPIGGLLAGWLAQTISFRFAFMILGGIEIAACVLLLPTRYFLNMNQD